MYAVWCTGEHEFYDLKKDPYEMNNLYNQANVQLVNRLDALLIVLKSCRAETCRDPWRVLHPTDRSVKTLQDALDEKYDLHYTQFKTVQYEECIGYYDAANELPQIGQHFIANTTARHNDMANQHVFKSLRKRSNEEGKYILPKEYHDLFKLVPKSSKSVGHVLPDEDFERHAIPVDDKLIQNPVNWAEYNFYGFGN